MHLKKIIIIQLFYDHFRSVFFSDDLTTQTFKKKFMSFMESPNKIFMAALAQIPNLSSYSIINR